MELDSQLLDSELGVWLGVTRALFHVAHSLSSEEQLALLRFR